MRRVLSFPSLLACALSLWALVAVPVTAGEIEDIQALVEKKQLAAASTRLTEFLKANPKDIQGRFLRGLLLIEEQKQTEAIQVFQELTEEFPDRPEPFNNLAVLYAEQGQLEKARDVLIRAINSRPGYATARENLGDIYAKLAAQSYRKALQVNRDNSVTEAKLALVRNLFVAPTGSGGTTATAAPPRLPEEFLRKARTEAVDKVRAEAMDKLRAEAMNQVRTEVLDQVRAEVRQKLHAEILAHVQATEMEKLRSEAMAQVKSEERERADAEALERSRADIEAKVRAEKERALALEQQAKEKQQPPRETKAAPPPPAPQKKGDAKKDVKDEGKEKDIKDEAPAAMKQLAKGQVKTADQAVRAAHLTQLDQVFEAVERAAAGSGADAASARVAPKRPQSPENAAQETQAVEKAVRGWAEAWSERAVPRYLAAYARDFQLPEGFSHRDEWSRKRKYLIGRAKSIQVGLEDMHVRLESPNTARVTFTQSYHSDKFHDVTHKTILMKKEGETWKILQEGVDD